MSYTVHENSNNKPNLITFSQPENISKGEKIVRAKVKDFSNIDVVALAESNMIDWSNL